MKNTLHIVLAALLSPILLLPGCQDEGETPAGEIGSTFEEVSDDIARESSQAWDSLKDTTYDERQTVANFFSELGSRTEAGVAELRMRAEELGTDSSSAWNNARDNFEDAYDRFESRMTDLQNATESNWEDARDATRDAWADVVEAYEDLRASIRAS